MRWAAAFLVAACAATAALAAPSGGTTAAVSADRVRIARHPGFVRAVVDFRGGRLGSNDSEATEPDPFDGSAAVAVRHAGVRAQAPLASAHGLRVRLTGSAGRVTVRLDAARRRFKYMRRTQLRDPERVVLDLYASRPPGPGAQIRRAPNGCIALGAWTVAPGRVRASGTARFIFESSFVLVVRGADGRVRGRSIVTFGSSGTWTRTVRYRVARREPGTLEAVELSARDGALSCLAQVRVALLPA